MESENRTLYTQSAIWPPGSPARAALGLPACGGSGASTTVIRPYSLPFPPSNSRRKKKRRLPAGTGRRLPATGTWSSMRVCRVSPLRRPAHHGRGRACRGRGPGEQPPSRSNQEHSAPRCVPWKPYSCDVAVARAFPTRPSPANSRSGIRRPQVGSPRPRACGKARQQGIDHGHAGLPPQVPIATISKYHIRTHRPSPLKDVAGAGRVFPVYRFAGSTQAQFGRAGPFFSSCTGAAPAPETLVGDPPGCDNWTFKLHFRGGVDRR
jgi:hypothetical protein